MDIKIKRINPNAVIPKYATALSAGFDLVAVETTLLLPGATAVIPVGFSIELPEGYELQVRPRSGISLKTKLRLSNSPGTVDADFRNEVGVLVDNLNIPIWLTSNRVLNIKHEWEDLDEFDIPVGSYLIKAGERIAQGVVARVEHVNFIESDDLSKTDRTGGFGSTGVV